MIKELFKDNASLEGRGTYPPGKHVSRLTFESVYREWSMYVYSLAYRLTGNKTDAEDLAQESFIRVFRFLKDYKGGSLKGWIYKIVTNVFYLQAEKSKKGPVLPEDDQFVERLSGPSPEDVAETLERSETQVKVQKAIAELPPDFRAAVVLADLEELDYKKIAELLDVPVGTVRSRISRGRHLLKEKLIERRAGGREMSGN